MNKTIKFVCLFSLALLIIFQIVHIAPVITKKAHATCSISEIQSSYAARNLSGSGLEQEAIDKCLAELRSQRQTIPDASNLQENYETKLAYFYKLDSLEKELDKLDTNGQCRFASVDCLQSMKIPSDPTTLSPSLFLEYMGNKEKCFDYMSQCIEKQIAAAQTQNNDNEACSDKYGPNWIWDGSYCVCKDGYSQKDGKCMTYDQFCSATYPNTNFLKIDSTTGNKLCDCKTGYQWNSSMTACQEAAAPSAPPTSVSDKSVAASSAASATSVDTSTIPEGAIIKTADNPDVYIVKYKDGKRYKRLILSPSVFRSYGHLRWEDLITVNQQTIDSFTTSNFVQVAGDSNVFELTPQGDIGEKRVVILDAEGYQLAGVLKIRSTKPFDYDAVYEINIADRDSYITK